MSARNKNGMKAQRRAEKADEKAQVARSRGEAVARLRQQSMMFNRVVWRLAVAMGEVAPEVEEFQIDGGVEALVDRVVARLDGSEKAAVFVTAPDALLAEADAYRESMLGDPA